IKEMILFREIKKALSMKGNAFFNKLVDVVKIYSEYIFMF
ncbi:hypothetical protein QEG_1924, partial [Clostridioides difficile CD127]